MLSDRPTKEYLALAWTSWLIPAESGKPFRPLFLLKPVARGNPLNSPALQYGGIRCDKSARFTITCNSVYS
jgi:hypothetical protein